MLAVKITDVAWDNVWPVVTLVAGYMLSRADEARRRRHEHDVATADRRRSFERETYLELQDILPELQQEVVGECDHWRKLHLRTGSDFPKMAAEPPRENVPYDRLEMRAKVLASRIADDDVRASVEGLLGKMSKMVGDAVAEGKFPDFNAELAPLGHEIGSTVRLLGERLRAVL